MGQEKRGRLLDCKDLSFKDAPIPDDLILFIVNSNVKRGLIDIIDNVLDSSGDTCMTGSGFGGCVVAIVPTILA
jgi:galactokinase